MASEAGREKRRRRREASREVTVWPLGLFARSGRKGGLFARSGRKGGGGEQGEKEEKLNEVSIRFARRNREVG